MVKLTFLGGAKTVTGSSYLLETDKLKIMVDCGMFQGNRELRMRNYRTPLVAPQSVDFILLTHAHIDHSGLIPRFCNQGFQGKIITTKATADLCQIMLPDCGHIQETEAEWETRKAKRRGDKPAAPLYTVDDATRCLKFLEPVTYGKEINLNDQVRIRFLDAGHILGSSIIEVWVKESGQEIKIVFSGDLGHSGTAILRDPTFVQEADYILTESTYGDRLHEPIADQATKLKEIITKTIAQKGNVVIPSFAVGRTQEILYALNNMVESNQMPVVPVFIDSPLAVSATNIFRQNTDCYDEEALKVLQGGDDPFNFPGLKYVQSVDESRAINSLAGGAVIISASGMCDAGRIKHHLKHNLWRQESAVVFVGYQGEGTLGRRIMEGQKKVKVLGEVINVAAQIYSLQGFSAHADQKGILTWLSQYTSKPQRIFVVHGEEKAATTLASLINQQIGVPTSIPGVGEEYILNPNGAVRTEMPATLGVPPVVDNKRQLLLTIIHLEKKLSDLKEDIVLSESNCEDQAGIERITGEISERIDQLGQICPHKY
jgi:metallo-beta-lactamase family protein